MDNKCQTLRKIAKDIIIMLFKNSPKKCPWLKVQLSTATPIYRRGHYKPNKIRWYDKMIIMNSTSLIPRCLARLRITLLPMKMEMVQRLVEVNQQTIRYCITQFRLSVKSQQIKKGWWPKAFINISIMNTSVLWWINRFQIFIFRLPIC